MLTISDVEQVDLDGNIVSDYTPLGGMLSMSRRALIEEKRLPFLQSLWTRCNYCLRESLG